jgi:hypothetical protein
MFKQLKLTVLAFLGIAAFVQKDGKEQITEEQKGQMVKEFGAEYTESFIKALDMEAKGEAPDATFVNTMVTNLSDHLRKVKTANAELDNTVKTMKTKTEKLQTEIDEQKKTIEILGKKPETDPPGSGTGLHDPKVKWIPDGKDTHLFGSNLPFMAIDTKHPYNMRAYAALTARAGLQVLAPMAASSLDYQSLKDDLGDYYRIRKQDRIQSFLQELPSLTGIFPLESGYQDQAVLVNLFITDDFSQADSTALGSDFDSVVKGGYKFEPEILTMYDSMFAHKFTQLKELEKGWLGYLNREGSSTMKWSFIEYILVETGKKLRNEQNLRWINGIRKNPVKNVPGTAMGASNGLLKFLRNQIALLKVKVFELGEWTPSTIAGYIKTGTFMVPQNLRDSGRIVLYMTMDALSYYHQNLEMLHGLQQDYKPGINYVHEYPSVKIIPIPGMSPSKRMVWTIDGNISLFEDQPGEMLNFNIEQVDWSLKVWSNWRESVWAYYVGKKYDSAAEMPSDYSTQLIFCNDVDMPADYYAPMEANDTTPSVLNHSSLVSVANSQATAITDIDDCAVNQEVRLKCGPGTNPITIAQAGKFSLLTAAWTPAVGDILYLKKRSDGKFIELLRSNATSDAIVIDADDATPDVAAGTEFITSANQNATAITTFDNAVAGTVYKINGGSDTHASTIANNGNFVLTAAMTLSAGTWIRLQLAANGKFYEIDRNA